MTKTHIYTARNRPTNYMARKEPMPQGVVKDPQMAAKKVQGAEWHYLGVRNIEDLDLSAEVRKNIEDELEKAGTSIFISERKVA